MYDSRLIQRHYDNYEKTNPANKILSKIFTRKTIYVLLIIKNFFLIFFTQGKITRMYVQCTYRTVSVCGTLKAIYTHAIIISIVADGLIYS
jgi:hypothetical protein